MGLPERTCSAPRRSIILVPEAWQSPKMPSVPQNSATWAVISAGKLGWVSILQDEFVPAREAYEKSLVIAKRLAVTDPSNTQWQLDLSIGYDGLGSVLIPEGEFGPAREAFEKSLDIRKRLAVIDPRIRSGRAPSRSASGSWAMC